MLNKLNIKLGLMVFAPLLLILSGLLIYRRRVAIRFAALWLGIEENAGNAGFKDADFEAEIKKVAGYVTYQQWCAYFVRFIMLSVTRDKYKDSVKAILSPSTQTTWKNAENDKTGLVAVEQKPKIGDVVIWQSKTDYSKGHTGIVTKVNTESFDTIEGNYNKYNGQFNEGVVTRVKRTFTGDGMILKGFLRFDRKIFKLITNG